LPDYFPNCGCVLEEIPLGCDIGEHKWRLGQRQESERETNSRIRKTFGITGCRNSGHLIASEALRYHFGICSTHLIQT
jgi:hypothetical protein